jgi:hypothetical protein
LLVPPRQRPFAVLFLVLYYLKQHLRMFLDLRQLVLYGKVLNASLTV